MKEKKTVNLFKNIVVFSLRLFFTFALVFFVGFIGIRHYRSTRPKVTKNYIGTSGNLLERPQLMHGTSKQVIEANGVKFDITRTVSSNSIETTMEQLTTRKLGLGWEKMKIPDKSIPHQTLNLKGDQNSFEFFINKLNRIEGYRIYREDEITKITSVALNLKDLTETTEKKGNPSQIVRTPPPSRYLEVMPSMPLMSMNNEYDNDSGIYICKIPNRDISNVAIDINSRLNSNGWEQELWEEVVEKNNLLNDGKMISARKNRILCNIIISEEGNNAIVSYRFSNIQEANIRR